MPRLEPTPAPVALSIVIPALNESARLPSSLVRIDTFLAAAADLCPAEILIVDDGSTDATSAIGAGHPCSPGVTVRTLRHDRNRGKGAAVRTGFAASAGRAVLLCDADLSAPIEGVRRLLAAFDTRAVVIGSRAVDRSLLTIRQPLYRDLMGRSFNLLVRLLLVPGILDTQCGFKLFPGPLARKLAAVQSIDGFAFDVELLAVASAWRRPLVEIGIPWAHVEASRVQPLRHSAQMFRDLLFLAIRRLRRRWPPEEPMP